MYKKNYVVEKKIESNTNENGLRIVTKKIFFCRSRPSVLHRIATDWVIGGYLKWCLMYSRDLYNIIYIITRLSKDIIINL